MKKLFQLFILILSSSIAYAQVKDEGPKAYFGYPGLDSMSRIDLLKFDTLKIDNQNLRVMRYKVILSCYNCSQIDVSLSRIEGLCISNNKELLKNLSSKSNSNMLLTVMDIEFINSKGRLIKYPREFSFKLYE